MSSTLASVLGGPFIQHCRQQLPKVLVKFRISDSDTLRPELSANAIDLALLYEDQLIAGYARMPLFRQRLYYVAPLTSGGGAGTISISRLAGLPLVLPGLPNIVRTILEREFLATA